MSKILGFTEKEIAISSIDYFTIGHFIFGYITNLLSYFIILLIFNRNFFGLNIAISTNVGLIWEFLENFLLLKTGIKFENKKDSLENSLTDILFVTIGSIVCEIITICGLIAIFVMSTFILIITIALYELLRIITYRRSNNGRKKENCVA